MVTTGPGGLPESKVVVGVTVLAGDATGVMVAVDKASGYRVSSASQPATKPETTIKQQIADNVLRLNT
jgi:hypothetical protein